MLKSFKLNSVTGAVLIIFASVCWGLSAVAFIPHLYNLPTTFVVLMQNLLSLLLLFFIYPKEYGNLKKLSSKTIFLLSLIALFSGVIGTLAIVKALFLVNFKQLSVVVLIQKVQPVFTVLLAVFFLGEKFSRNFILWSLAVLIGIYLITFGFALPEWSNRSDYMTAYLLSFLSAASFSVNTIIGRYLASDISFITITFNRFLFGTLFSIAICLITGTFFCFSSMTIHNWIFILAIIMTAGPPSMLIYYIGLKYVKAMVSAICELALPFSVIILDYLLNGNILTSAQWIGAIIMIFGIFKISNFSVNLKEKQK